MTLPYFSKCWAGWSPRIHGSSNISSLLYLLFSLSLVSYSRALTGREREALKTKEEEEEGKNEKEEEDDLVYFAVRRQCQTIKSSQTLLIAENWAFCRN